MRRELKNNNQLISDGILQYLGYTWGYARCYWFMVGYIVAVFLIGWLILYLKAKKS